MVVVCECKELGGWWCVQGVEGGGGACKELRVVVVCECKELGGVVVCACKELVGVVCECKELGGGGGV